MKTTKTADRRCAVKFVHEDRVRAARKSLHNGETTASLSETFKVLGDPTRLRIVLALSKEELCVCDIAALLEMTDSAISHQLRLLSALRLIKRYRRGKMVYYALDDRHIEALIRVAVRHVSEQ